VAFAAIGNAFAVLSDTQKRKRYDAYGTDEPELRRRGRSDGYEYDYSRGFEGKNYFCLMSLGQAFQSSWKVLLIFARFSKCWKSVLGGGKSWKL